MPIGSAKIGVLGAGLVPGGTVTFNATSTWTVPPGVKKVSITGRGGTGNSGNAGNPGNAGNAGTGAGGGAGGQSDNAPLCITYKAGGKGGAGGTGGGTGGNNNVPYNTPTNTSANPGNAGNSGSAGNAGAAGNPGTAGNASTGLTYNFAGGAGGNAGGAGNAGNGGTGGTAGNAGTNWLNSRINCCPQGLGTNAPAGNGGNGGGQGMQIPAPLTAKLPTANRPLVELTTPAGNCPGIIGYDGGINAMGVSGGGGAGETNSGQTINAPTVVSRFSAIAFANPGANIPNGVTPLNCWWAFPTLALGGNPGGGRGGIGVLRVSGRSYSSGGNTNGPWNCLPGINANAVNVIANWLCGRPGNNARAGGGGGSGGTNYATGNQLFNGGGGGGGGRGNAGNAGGAGSSGGAGSAATPQTFNCVPVTPGSPYPIVVGGPTGGQIVISWNPQ